MTGLAIRTSALTLALPFLPIGAWFQFVVPPPAYFGFLVVVVAGFLITIEPVKRALYAHLTRAVALVGALLNKAAGGADNPTADAAITTAGSLLASHSLNLLTSDVAPSSVLGQALLNAEVVLNNYNNANFNTFRRGCRAHLTSPNPDLRTLDSIQVWIADCPAPAEDRSPLEIEKMFSMETTISRSGESLC